MTEITKMLTKRALLCPDYTSSEHVKMSRYLSVLKIGIREFVSNNRYKTLAEMQEHDRRMEIELETQMKEKGRLRLHLSQKPRNSNSIVQGLDVRRFSHATSVESFIMVLVE